MNKKITAGPPSKLARPIVLKIPAPTIAAIPKPVKSRTPKVLFIVAVFFADSAKMDSTVFFLNNCDIIYLKTGKYKKTKLKTD